MATLPKMLESIQPFDGRDSGTLLQFGRILREAGFIPAGKRGKGAPNMGLDHTVNLLLGLYGAASPKDAPKALTNLRTLVPLGVEGDFDEHCEVLADIRQRATFGEAMEELVLGLPEIVKSILRRFDPDGSLSTQDEKAWCGRIARGMGPLNLRVSLFPVGAEIVVDQAMKPLWKATYVADGERLMAGEYNDAQNVDRQPTTRFSIASIAGFHMAMMEGLEA